MVGRQHFPANSWPALVFETDSVTWIHLWLRKLKFLYHPEIYNP